MWHCGSPSTLTPVQIMRWVIGALETANVLSRSDTASDSSGVQWRLSPCHSAKPLADENGTAGTSATSFPALIKRGLWDRQIDILPSVCMPPEQQKDHCIYRTIIATFVWGNILVKDGFCAFKLFE